MLLNGRQPLDWELPAIGHFRQRDLEQLAGVLAEENDTWVRPLEPVAPTVVDVRAVASGRRRVRSLAEYREAQARVRGGQDG